MALNLRISWLGRAADTLERTPEGAPLSGCKSCGSYVPAASVFVQEDEREQRHKTCPDKIYLAQLENESHPDVALKLQGARLTSQSKRRSQECAGV